MKNADLVGRLYDLLYAEDPRAFAQRVLEICSTDLKVVRTALFAREQEQMHLMTSMGLDQAVLDFVSAAWASHRQPFLGGQVFHGTLTASRTVTILPVQESGRL